MFFFFFDDFKESLDDFVVDPKLRARSSKAQEELAGFRDAYPFERLRRMTVAELVGDGTGDLSFCDWIGRKTSHVGDRVPWVGNKLDSIRQRWAIDERNGRRDLQQLLECLVRFVESRGEDCSPVLESVVGTPLLLKILYLYWDRQTFNIFSVKHLTDVERTLALEYQQSVFRKSAALKCYLVDTGLSSKFSDVELSVALDEYIGLTSFANGTFSAAAREFGLPQQAVVRIERRMRQFFRLLSGFDISKMSLTRITEKDLHSLRSLEAHLHDRLSKVGSSLRFCKEIDQYIEVLSNHRMPKPRMAFSMSNAVSAKHVDFDRSPSNELGKRLKSAKSAAEVLAALQRSGSTRAVYSHYSTLTSFLHISESCEFRMTRGDDPNMNDQLECRRIGDPSVWRRTFIISFSGEKGESAAMWGLYGKPANEALRFSFRHGVMSDWVRGLSVSKGSFRIQLKEYDGVVGKKIDVPASDFNICFADILYGGNVSGNRDGADEYQVNGVLLRKKGVAFSDETVERSVEMTGFLKSSDWAYEDECRLVVRIKESASFLKDVSLDDIQYVYLPIEKDVLSQVRYMQGPCTSEKLLPVFEKKIKEVLNDDVSVDVSVYHGKLKFKV